MKRTCVICYSGSVLLCGLLLAGCSARARGQSSTPGADEFEGAPPPPNVVPVADASLFKVDRPDQFPLAAATERPTSSEMVVTGTVTPDINRSVPVVSLASGRVLAIHARLGDRVQKGQLLLTIRSDDVSLGYSNYRKAVVDETLARAQLARSQDLYDHGAVSKGALEIIQDTEDKAKVDLETMAEHLRLLGNNPDAPAGQVNIFAPVSGVITDQQVTNASAVQAFNGPSPFTISDLSSVWVVCDVYENDLATVKIGDNAEISLNAYPDRMFRGKVSNIGAILDPNLRTAKVRIEVSNPGILRLGMFARATFRGQTMEMHTIVPASAVMHMHDRDFVFVPASANQFRRVEIVGGDLVQNNTALQEIKSGLAPGQRLVTNALVLDHVLAQ
jgi:cobalt-zinc-cadmium efflux system membrane fusion protein